MRVQNSVRFRGIPAKQATIEISIHPGRIRSVDTVA